MSSPRSTFGDGPTITRTVVPTVEHEAEKCLICGGDLRHEEVKALRARVAELEAQLAAQSKNARIGANAERLLQRRDRDLSITQLKSSLLELVMYRDEGDEDGPWRGTLGEILEAAVKAQGEAK